MYLGCQGAKWRFFTLFSFYVISYLNTLGFQSELSRRQGPLSDPVTCVPRTFSRGDTWGHGVSGEGTPAPVGGVRLGNVPGSHPGSLGIFIFIFLLFETFVSFIFSACKTPPHPRAAPQISPPAEGRPQLRGRAAGGHAAYSACSVFSRFQVISNL